MPGIQPNPNCKIMGVVNVTPDSFSDGGQFLDPQKAIEHALSLLEAGADMVDVGGESTRPGASAVSVEEELQRVIPVIEGIAQAAPDALISVDTSKAEVMQVAVEAGAGFINDINALQATGALQVAVEADVPVCLMHKKGTPENMQNNPQYKDVLHEVQSFLQDRADNCLAAGIKPEHIYLDPGIGFGKSLQHNLILLKGLREIRALGFPLLLGVSRKAFIGAILDQPEADQRVSGSVAAAAWGWFNGADILRVHDVAETRQALKVLTAINQAQA